MQLYIYIYSCIHDLLNVKVTRESIFSNLFTFAAYEWYRKY